MRFLRLLWYTPSHRKFSPNRIGDHTGEVLSCFSLGVFGIQCACIALISLFLIRVWGHVFPIVSYRSKLCLSLSVQLLFLSFSSYTRVFLSQSPLHVGFLGKIAYVRGFTENSHICPDFFYFCCGTIQAIGSFLHNRIGGHAGDIPCFSLGFGGTMCLI